jgi:hypothetical protein
MKTSSPSLSTTPWERMGEWIIAPLILKTPALDGGKWSASRAGRLIPRKEPPYRLDKRLGGPHSRSECGGEEKCPPLPCLPLPCRESNPSRQARNLVTILTELPCLYLWYPAWYPSITRAWWSLTVNHQRIYRYRQGPLCVGWLALRYGLWCSREVSGTKEIFVVLIELSKRLKGEYTCPEIGHNRFSLYFSHLLCTIIVLSPDVLKVKVNLSLCFVFP